MKKVKSSKLTPFLCIAFSLLSFSCSKEQPAIEEETYTQITYTESDEDFINPERGFYKSCSYYFNSNDEVKLTTGDVERIRNQGFSLVHTGCILREFRDKDISSAYLAKLRNNMEALRSGGVKTILRFTYTYDTNDKPWDAPWEITQRHIEQLSPILQEYADVIYVLQAGFVGVWGEWYFTENYVFQPKSKEDYEPRRQVLQALLKALPAKRMINLRTPAFTMNLFDKSIADTLTLSTAYSGADYARVGGHNDCFLANEGDAGTFFNDDQRKFWQHNLQYTAMGGETCLPSSFTEAANTLLQLANYHWSYLNMDYHQDVIESWVTNGCIEIIKRKLGYRMSLTSGRFSELAQAGCEYSIELKIKNTGWAAPVNPRKVEIVFVNQTSGKEYRFDVDVNPQFWFANTVNDINTKIKLPQAMETGEYNIYLNLPDPESTLNKNPKFSIQLANTNTWNEDKGYNLIHTVSVSAE